MFQNDKKKIGFSRRDFVKGASAAAAGAAVIGLAGSAIAVEAEPLSGARPDWLPEKWDYTTDILVVGHGMAGTSAVIEARRLNLGEVMVIDAAPRGEDRGTSSVCGQFVLAPTDTDDFIAYTNHLNGEYVVPDEFLLPWAEEMCKNGEWLEEIGAEGFEPNRISLEFPEAPGSDAIVCLHGGGNGGSYNKVKAVEEQFDFVDLAATRARKLIHNPATKEVWGIVAETESGLINIMARKGVILACGGFEYNDEMMKTYFPVGVVPQGEGSPYNRGDGVLMAQALGAKLWHMNNYASIRYYAQIFGPGTPLSLLSFGTKSYIYIGPDSKRNEYEEWHSAARHGKKLDGGVWTTLHTPSPGIAIFDQACFDARRIMQGPDSGRGWPGTYGVPGTPPETNEEAVELGIIFKAETVEELASKVSYLDPEILAETVETYNYYCEIQDDKDFHRGKGIVVASAHAVGSVGGTASGSVFDLEPIAGPPYYGLPIVSGIINSQGGPERNAKSEVLNVWNEPIPRLYSAGEMGAPYPHCYNGGGNMGDGMVSGRVAARNAGALEPLVDPA